MTRDPSSRIFALREEIDSALERRVDYEAWSPELKTLRGEHQRDLAFGVMRFQIVIGLMLGLASLVWDAVALPQLLDRSILWRTLTIVPLAIYALFVLRRGQNQQMKWALSLSFIALGMLAMHLASYGTMEAMTRYSMATSLILGMTCLAIPFTPAELRRYALAFGVATSAAGIWPNPLPPFELALYMAFTALIAFPALSIAQRNWRLNARGFLLDLRDEMTRMELEQSNALLRQLSEQDPLTGMPNRRKFERVVKERLESLPSDGSQTGNLAVMMIDLDQFKAFNDRHGHQAGDRCLVLTAAQLLSVFPPEYGVLARYGGEEFIAALREREPGEAERLAEEMRAAIAEMLVPVRDDSQPLITTSIGLALAPVDARLDLEDLIEMADVALYSAKRAGRDRVEVIHAGHRPQRSRHRQQGERRRA